jgi:hypothetical protein
MEKQEFSSESREEGFSRGNKVELAGAESRKERSQGGLGFAPFLQQVLQGSRCSDKVNTLL